MNLPLPKFNQHLYTKEEVQQIIEMTKEQCAVYCEELANEVQNQNWIAIQQRNFCATEIRKLK